jgi:predicted signal transduction protein with EAL and GGDEF domain
MRTARRTLIIALALAAPNLAIGLLAPGAFGSKLVGAGLVLLIPCAIAAVWMWWQGKKVDQEQDEREEAIVSASARFAFFAMAVALQAYYAWRFSIVGPDEPSFWLAVALWGSFAAAYAYNRIRM